MMQDERLEKVETVTINWETYKKALKKNYLDNKRSMFRDNHNFVLRLYPPFESEMTAEYYESEHGVRYANDWSPKPFHIHPELILLEGTGRGKNPFNWVEWPTERTTRDALRDEVVKNNDIDELVAEGREIFWSEIKSFLPDTFDLGKCHGHTSYEVELNWDFGEN